uniref:Uncharacterized protein n=1 Tax=Anguilla anguilla TaxID=7936 RepID=A0A0E9VTI7_ANGAN
MCTSKCNPTITNNANARSCQRLDPLSVKYSTAKATSQGLTYRSIFSRPMVFF